MVTLKVVGNDLSKNKTNDTFLYILICVFRFRLCKLTFSSIILHTRVVLNTTFCWWLVPSHFQWIKMSYTTVSIVLSRCAISLRVVYINDLANASDIIFSLLFADVSNMFMPGKYPDYLVIKTNILKKVHANILGLLVYQYLTFEELSKYVKGNIAQGIFIQIYICIFHHFASMIW